MPLQSAGTLILLLFGAVGCRFDYRAPTGARGEETAVQGITSSFYRSLAEHDTAVFERVVFPAATLLLDDGKNPVTLVPARTLLDLRGDRTDRTGVRLVRSEVRTDGDLATVRSVLATGGSRQKSELEASDFLTLARRDGVWRIAHALFGPWRLRSAP